MLVCSILVSLTSAERLGLETEKETRKQYCYNMKMFVVLGFIVTFNNFSVITIRADPAFLERGFICLLSANEKLPVSNFRYFGKYIIELFGYCYVHVSGQRQADLER